MNISVSLVTLIETDKQCMKSERLAQTLSSVHTYAQECSLVRAQRKPAERASLSDSSEPTKRISQDSESVSLAVTLPADISM